MRILFVILFCMSSTLFAQKVQTIYFDADSKATSQEKALFYSIITQDKKDTSLYEVKTYYKNGGKMFNSTYKAIRFPSTWEKLYQFDFVDALKEGTLMEYNKTGILCFQANYVNGQPEGKVNRYYEDGKPYIIYESTNGKLDGELIEYYKNGKKKFKAVFKEGKITGKVNRYDENEQIIIED